MGHIHHILHVSLSICNNVEIEPALPLSVTQNFVTASQHSMILLPMQAVTSNWRVLLQTASTSVFSRIFFPFKNKKRYIISVFILQQLHLTVTVSEQLKPGGVTFFSEVYAFALLFLVFNITFNIRVS